jgi:hypothetical protein
MGLAPTIQPVLAPMYAAQPVAADNGFTSLTEEIPGNPGRQEQVLASLVRNRRVEQGASGEPIYPQSTPLAVDSPFQPLPEMTQAPYQQRPLITPGPLDGTPDKPFVSKVRAPLGETIDSSIAEQGHGTDLRPASLTNAGESIEVSTVFPVESAPQRPISARATQASLPPIRSTPAPTGTIRLAETQVTTPSRRASEPETTLPFAPGQREQERSPSEYRREDVPTESQSPAAPTIQVTIGRIEVRATPPTAAPPQHSGPKVMDLDEYLSQRAKGGH